LVIEFVSRDDDKVRTLLRNRPDPCADYALAHFECSLSQHFVIAERLQLSGGLRQLYYCRLKETVG
jgi:hypothetical protein